MTDAEDLRSVSKKDKPWDDHKALADRAAHITNNSKQAVRLASCSEQLYFRWSEHRDTGEAQLKLKSARFCRVRTCPICQWRRSLMWRARFFQAMPSIQSQHPNHRWLLLTLTVRNCQVTDLRSTLQTMSKAWHKLIRRQVFEGVTGWVRATEITRGKDRSAHPHYHCLLLVKPSKLSGRNYTPQRVWSENWQQCLGIDYLPIVDIRRVRNEEKGAVEVLKYTTKSADVLNDPGWFNIYAEQIVRLRLIASGGLLKDLWSDERSNDELIGTADELVDHGHQLTFNWRHQVKRYRRKQQTAPSPQS